jgi:hypothetical protein
MRWNKKEENKLRELYLDKSISINKIIKLLKRTPASIHNKILALGVRKTRSPKKFIAPSSITPALARIHAHVCGDGNLFRSSEKDSYGYLGIYKPNRRRYRYGIGYTNKNQRLIEEFMRDTESTFCLKPYYRNNYVRVKSRDIWVLLKQLGAGKSRDWFISSTIMKANKRIKKHWIRAFFDDEACFNADGRIRVRSVNRKGITQVKKMLNGFLPSHITPKNKCYPDGSVYLNINRSDVEKYFYKIGSLRYCNKSK